MLEIPIPIDGGEILLASSTAGSLPGYERMAFSVCRFFVRGWLRQADGKTLVALESVLGMRRTGHDPSDPDECATRLLERLEGETPALVLHRRLRTSIELDFRPPRHEVVDLASLDSGEVEPREPPPTGWIEICLRDRNDQPVPNTRYEVRLPNRELRWGRLDRRGLARLEGIPDGDCEVSFPDYDRSSWDRA